MNHSQELNAMRQIVPATLQAARLARGLSLSALSKLCGISAPTLSRIETGARSASDDEINRIAAALSYPVAALCRPLVSPSLGLSGFYHRKLSSAAARPVNAIENRCLLDVVALRELLGMVDYQQPKAVLSIHLDDAKGSAEQAANMVRLAWRLPRGPVRNLCAEVESRGCVVIHNNFDLPKMDALYQKVRGLPPIFWVNSVKPLDRVRWSLAHELGHLVLHEEEPVDDKLAEDQANEFASAFLMPRADFRSECPSRLNIPTLVELKRRWRCSMQAIIRRAHDVGRIDKRQYTNLMIALTKKGWRTGEPYPIAPESPQLLANAVRTCLSEFELSVEELADRIAVPVEQIVEWMQPFPGQKHDPDRGGPKLRLAADY